MFIRFTVFLLCVSTLASAIEVSMIDMEDVMENHRIVTDSSDPNNGSPYPVAGDKGARGVSFIKSNLKKILTKTANMGTVEMDPSEWHEVQTTYLTGTSNYHQDHKHDGAATLVEEEVGFIALNTNDDAYFDHPDMKVPIREGAFIRFKGSDPHRTVVKQGSVHLLGPFDIKTFGKVGGVTCCDNDTGNCFDIDAVSSCPNSAPTFLGTAECEASCTKAGKAGKSTKAQKGGSRKRLRN